MVLPSGNRIIDVFAPQDTTGVLNDARIVTLERTQMTTLRDTRMENVDFPTTALMSVVGVLEDGATCELASIGTEAFVEIDAALRTDMALRTALCVLEGDAVRISLEDFRNGLERSAAFSELIYHAVRARIFVTEQIAMCNARHTIVERLARWLLLASFRANRHEFSITHEHLAGILGARRASISQATAALAARDAIENRRNTVTIRDHGRLVDCSCECYAVARHAIHTAGA